MDSTPTLSPPKFYGLDHLRALAIVLVFGFHYQLGYFGFPEWAKEFNQFGWTGVDLFFVLSGFLISSQLFAQMKAGKGISLKVFFTKRFFRIIPIYLVVVAIYFCFPFFREQEQLPELWRFLTFTQNFGLDRVQFGTFSHAWSLCVEEHFYLFLPLILLFLTQTNRFQKAYWILIFLFLAGFVIRYLSWHYLYLPAVSEQSGQGFWAKYIYYPTYNRLDGLLIGVSIAALYQYLPGAWVKISKYGNLLLIAGLGLLTVAYIYCSDLGSYETSIYGFPFVSLGYGFLVLGAICPSSVLYRWNSRTTTFIATLSYGIYLSHKGVVKVTQDLLTPLGIEDSSNLMFILCTAASVIVAWVLHQIIEKPFMKIRDRILKRKKVEDKKEIVVSPA
jgi:peptidoglycan/LPS O-acetylase OafA/YrhL